MRVFYKICCLYLLIIIKFLFPERRQKDAYAASLLAGAVRNDHI